MDGIKEEAIHHTALKLAEEIKNLSIYKSFYNDVQVSTTMILQFVTKSLHNKNHLLLLCILN